MKAVEEYITKKTWRVHENANRIPSIGGLKKIEVICFTETTSFPLLTLTYSKKTGDFVLVIERRFIAQKSTLQALIEALEKVKEVMQNNGMEQIER